MEETSVVSNTVRFSVLADEENDNGMFRLRLRRGNDINYSEVVVLKTYPARNPNGWNQTGGKWYYQDESGEWVSGWKKIGAHWYFFASDFSMQTGWLKRGIRWYYLRESGSMVTGWKQVDGQWYYMDANGVMQTGWLRLASNGKWYYLKESGQMAAFEWCKGYWLNADGSWTYPYKASWKKDAKGWWYGDTSGWYAKNRTYVIDGKSYTFNSAGYWVP